MIKREAGPVPCTNQFQPQCPRGSAGMLDNHTNVSLLGLSWRRKARQPKERGFWDNREENGINPSGRRVQIFVSQAP